MIRVEALLGTLVAFSAVVACNRSPDDLREWQPSDHRHTTETAPENTEPAQVTGSAEAPLPGLDEVTIAAFRRACVQCHGQLGRGDGPQGPMVKARDLSDPAWQHSVTDAQLAAAITTGKGLMPAFPLPPSTIEGLVHLVRLLNRDRLERPAPTASAPGGPAAAP